MFSAFLWWICGACAGGVVGNRMDWLSMNAVKKIRNAFERPENHDIAQTLATSVFKSLQYFLKDMRVANPFPGLDQVIAECEEVVIWTEDVKRIQLRQHKN